MFFNLLLKYYKETFIKANEKDNVDRQLQNIVEQYRVNEEKDNELRIARHDMRHLLITISSLIAQDKDAYKIVIGKKIKSILSKQ